MARVLPVPAPASTQTGPRAARATSRCSGSSPASNASDVPGITSATGSSCPIRGTQPATMVLQHLDFAENELKEAAGVGPADDVHHPMVRLLPHAEEAAGQGRDREGR